MTDATFFDRIRHGLFGGKLSQSQVDGIVAIRAGWALMGDDDAHKLSYILATSFHETAETLQPIYERGAKVYFNKYEPGTKIGKALGNTHAGDGYLFRGRGFVQLTGRANYAEAGKALGIDLIGNPDLALELDVAAKILIRGMLEGWFTGKKLADYIHGTTHDFVGARHIINGTDRASTIALYAKQFDAALAAV